jgi:putative flippase GtrA
VIARRATPSAACPASAPAEPAPRPRGAQSLGLFLVFGGVGALANLLAGWLLYGVRPIPGLPYWLATSTAATAGLVVNFALNYSFNFRYRRRSALEQFCTFCAVAGVGVVLTGGLSTMLLGLLRSPAGHDLVLGALTLRPDLAAHAGAVGLVVLYSFPAHKAVSFNVGIRARLSQLHALLRGCERIARGAAESAARPSCMLRDAPRGRSSA